MSLGKSCKIILNDCMDIRKNEKCLIVTDKKLLNIGKILYKNLLKITRNSNLVVIPIPKTHGSEPPKKIACEMLKYDVILMPTTRSLSHTKARENASKKGARIASMPGTTDDMMKRALNVDFRKIKIINDRLIKKLKDKDKIKIITGKGTNAEFLIKGRKWVSDDGIYTKKGAFGNLPAGEIFIAPLEGKTNGIIADAMIGDGKKLEKEIKIKIESGYISHIEGQHLTEIFIKMLKNKFYRNVAELGIGTNYKAKITGNVLEDEKVAGTCHIAFGNNKHFGGKVDVPFHVDFVIRKPTIYAGNILIKKEGKLTK